MGQGGEEGKVNPNKDGLALPKPALRWTEGKCIVFDDSYEHEVWNDSDQDRVVLLINFWHPALPPEQRRIEVNSHGYDVK